MKLKNIIMSLLLAGSISAAAQDTRTEYEYVPNWYVGAQVGAQYTLGEVSFGDLLSPNFNLMVGRNFSPVIGVRLGVNALNSKAGFTGGYTGETQCHEWTWKWSYVATNLDATFDLTNLIGGFNPERKWTVGALLGVGLNFGFDNDEAHKANTSISAYYNTAYPGANYKGQNLSHLWDGTKVRVQGRAGLYADYKINDNWAVGAEVNANILNDGYNSKHAPNADWYFNGLVGVKYTLGKTYNKKVVKVAQPETKVVEKIVEKIVEKPVKVVETKYVESNTKGILNYDENEALRVDVFFTISSTTIAPVEKLKVDEMVDFLKRHPEAKVEVTGYADKGTGKAAGNMRLSEKRADIVISALKKAGIPESRIIRDAKGDTVQPFKTNNLNRVTICVAQ